MGKTLVIAVARSLVGKCLKEKVVQKGDKRRKKEGKEGGKKKEDTGFGRWVSRYANHCQA